MDIQQEYNQISKGNQLLNQKHLIRKVKKAKHLNSEMNLDYRNRFVEQFEDSEQYVGNQGTGFGTSNNNDDGYPVQLIRVRPSGKVQVDVQALRIISQCQLPVGFVALVGKYRTGKSFLLNKLLYLEGRGFRVDPSTAACTEGIWMWSKPVYNQRLGNYLFFIDTQGSQSLTKDIQNDTKIFVIATLISSLLMFNSVGSIDQKSINELNVVSKLSMNVLIQENIKTRDNQEMLYRFMPKFLWILRDFTLQLKGYDGRKLSPRQYLEDCLLDQNTLIKTNEDSKKVRRALVNNFKQRDCVTLVRPAKQQRDLQRLDQLPENALRKQFIEGVNEIRDKIMKQAGPKMYEGTPLYGSSIASMIESYVQSMNTNGFPTIKTAWQHISDDEGVFAYNKALQAYNKQYEKYFNVDEPKGEQIHKILICLRDEALTEFSKNISQPNDLYHNKLKQFLAEKQEAILMVNRQLNDFRNIQILKQSASNLIRKIESKAYEGKPQQLNKDIEKAVEQYKRKAKGENKGDILSQFLANMSPIILQIQKPKVDEGKVAVAKIEKQEFDQRIKIMQQKNKSAQNKLQSAEQKNAKLAKQLEELKKKVKKNQGGCCGTGSCVIM